MEERIITEAMLLRYRAYLEEEEKSRNTIEKYMRDLRAFRSWLSDRPVSRQETAAYKERLKETYTVRSINSMLSSVNSFFRYCGWTDCCVRQLRVQNQIFCPRDQKAEERTSGSRHADDLRHRHPHQRAFFYYCRRSLAGKRGGVLQGKMPPGIPAPEAAADSETIYPQKENPFRPGLCDRERETLGQE